MVGVVTGPQVAAMACDEEQVVAGYTVDMARTLGTSGGSDSGDDC